MRPVFIAASPNTERDDVWEAVKQLLSPWSWYDSGKTKQFEQQVSSYFGGAETVAFDSARSSLYEILKCYSIGEGDEVIIPAFTCLVVANPVIWNGAKPVYADVDDDFNLSMDSLKKVCSEKTKAVLVQHTFGKAVDVDEVRRIVGKNVRIIEDIAHALGGRHKGKLLGTLGDSAIATFGIEKVISSVRGGMVITADQKLAERLRQDQMTAKRFSLRRIAISLKNPVFWAIVTPVYYLGVGKITIGRALTWLAHLIGLFGIMIEKCEYENKKPDWLPAQLPGALAVLGIKQFSKLERFNAHRREVAAIYANALGMEDLLKEKGNIIMRFPLLVNNRKKLVATARKQKVVLGDWYKSILYSPQQNLHYFQYSEGTAPKAEKYAAAIINLPTAVNVSLNDAERIAAFVKSHIETYGAYN